jgi:hypothetical protein
MEIVQSGSSDATVATLKVETMGEGSTGFQVNVLKMEDDNGDPMHPQAVTGSLTIC